MTVKISKKVNGTGGEPCPCPRGGGVGGGPAACDSGTPDNLAQKNMSNSSDSKQHSSGERVQRGSGTVQQRTKRSRSRTRRGTYATQPPSERHLAAARDVAAGMPISRALPAHGFAQSTADRGFAAFRESGGLMMAWTAAAEERMKQPLPPLEVRRHNWHHQAEADLFQGSNRRVPILRVVGQALGVLAPENQTVVAVQVNAAPSAAGREWLEDGLSQTETTPETTP